MATVVETAAGLQPGPHELETELVRARTRGRGWTVPRDRLAGIGLAAGFGVAAACELVLLPAVRPFSAPTAALAVVAYAAISRVEFEVANSRVSPGQLVLVPMLFALPPRAVPLVVAAGLVLAHLPEAMRRRSAATPLPIVLARASHALGPALVLALAAAGPPRWRDAPLYLAALASQFAAGAAPEAMLSPRRIAAMRVPILVDSALAPVALTTAIATHGHMWSVLAAFPIAALLKVFARERQMRVDHALELSDAYRGTAILLGDVIEADDEYTGLHSREVVDLVLAVSDELGVDAAVRRRAEFAALLHDVGKVKIPSEIINKPGPLDRWERLLMDKHTLIGEEMLETIGGLLGEVGHVVRSSHEHWDGSGYPDKLAGEQIPLAARIVSTCDTWSAMTTDRSYRKALTHAQAVAELRRCAGTQFDPAVVAALLAVLERG